jgi:hypothetical protein
MWVRQEFVQIGCEVDSRKALRQRVEAGPILVARRHYATLRKFIEHSDVIHAPVSAADNPNSDWSRVRHVVVSLSGMI